MSTPPSPPRDHAEVWLDPLGGHLRLQGSTRSQPTSIQLSIPPPIPPTPVPKWKGTAKAVLLSARSALAAFSLLSAILLTVFSASGIVTFQGQVVKWKLLLFSLLLEAAIYVLARDLHVLVVDYFLVYKGITHSELSHAMSATLSLSNVRGPAYKFYYLTIVLSVGILAPVLLSVVLVRGGEGSNRISADNQDVGTNTIGGKIDDNFGATGQSFLFNASNEKYKFSEDSQPYAIYRKLSPFRQCFVPKTPQIGPYSAECNSNENVDIIEARVLNVEGLLYTCTPVVNEVNMNIEDFDVPEGTSDETMRILKDSHKPDGNNSKALFHVEIAIKKGGENSTAVLSIPCNVTSAQATIDVIMTNDGVMSMKIADNTEIKLLNLILPDRVLGIEENALERALENSIGRKGIGIVKEYVTSSIAPWDGLIRAIVASYAIRSALKTTFADFDDTKQAINVKKISRGLEETQRLRVFALWIPVGLALISRFLTWVYPSIFNGGLEQLFAWIGSENGHAGGMHYREHLGQRATEPPSFLKLRVVEGGRSLLGLANVRDIQIALGSYRHIRRLLRRGLIGGWGQSARRDPDSSGDMKDASFLSGS